jgi:hypothetical protein
MAEPTKQGRGAGVYLFGLVPADADVAVERCPPFADDRAVHLVRTANLCALAASVDLGALGENGPVDLEPERLTALVEDHDRVLREVAASGRALVPAPFGTVVGDVNALRQLLERHCADLHDALTRLEGCDEWGVHVSAPREAPQRAVRSMAYQVHERLAACAERDRGPEVRRVLRRRHRPHQARRRAHRPAKREGHDVVVVVSAMGKTTDHLLQQAQEISPIPPGASSTCCSPPASGSPWRCWRWRSTSRG